MGIVGLPAASAGPPAGVNTRVQLVGNGGTPASTPSIADAAHADQRPRPGVTQRTPERRSWIVIWLCLFAMVAEIAGGVWSGSIALVADGLHTSTHVAVLLMAALAYRYADLHGSDPCFAFGTGKVGDLAGFAGGIVLAVVAVLIGWEAAARLIAPVPIGFASAIGLAAFGLVVNALSVWLLRAGPQADLGTRASRHLHRDNNMRAIVLHIIGDGIVSILVIAGLVGAQTSGALWLDPAAGIASAAMVLWLAQTLVRDTGAVLLDKNPGGDFVRRIRAAIEVDGDRVTDLHVWRLGPGQLGAVLTVVTSTRRQAGHYRAALASHTELAHLTIEVRETAGLERAGDPAGNRCSATRS